MRAPTRRAEENADGTPGWIVPIDSGDGSGPRFLRPASPASEAPYDDVDRAQVGGEVARRGDGDLQALLDGGDRWTVG
ncbi:MAG TPA: hypothetical protein VGE77_14020 [Nocardioides sp.]